LLDAFFTWAQLAERKLSARSELAQALRYIIKRRTALTRFATDARLEADTTSPKMRSGASPYSPAVIQAASVPPLCIRSCRPRN
jgi:hypothetical protein